MLFQEHVQKLFDEPIIRTEHIDPGYPNTNQVWLVDAGDVSYVVKVSGHTSDTPRSCFWLGLQELFGSKPLEELTYHPALAKYLNRHGEIPVPTVLRVESSNDLIGKPFTVMERANGVGAHGHDFVPKSIARQLGRHIGSLHSKSVKKFGNFPRTRSLSANEFPQRLVAALESLYAHAWKCDEEVQAFIDHYLARARRLPPPTHIALIMPDMSPEQFLVDNGRLSALVDIESCVWGPIELELVTIERFIRNGDAFRTGYEETFGALPPLEPVREVFRFFYYLLYNAPPKRLAEWIDAKDRDIRRSWKT